MPSWKKVDVDTGHIVKNHTVGGIGYQQSGGRKDKFYDYMSSEDIESTVRQAYRNAEVVRSSQVLDGEVRLKMQGTASGVRIEMWYNMNTKTIETAYPIGRG